jgi:hypothetical protein
MECVAAPSTVLSEVCLSPKTAARASTSGPQHFQTRVLLRIGGSELRFKYESRQLPGWARSVLASMQERWGVTPGWDSYGAQPTNPRHALRLLNALSALLDEHSSVPAITPLSDGGLQAEWHLGSKEFEVVASANEEVHYYFYDGETGEEIEEPLEEGLTTARSKLELFNR